MLDQKYPCHPIIRYRMRPGTGYPVAIALVERHDLGISFHSVQGQGAVHCENLAFDGLQKLCAKPLSMLIRGDAQSIKHDRIPLGKIQNGNCDKRIIMMQNPHITRFQMRLNPGVVPVSILLAQTLRISTERIQQQSLHSREVLRDTPPDRHAGGRSEQRGLPVMAGHLRTVAGIFQNRHIRTALGLRKGATGVKPTSLGRIGRRGDVAFQLQV